MRIEGIYVIRGEGVESVVLQRCHTVDGKAGHDHHNSDAPSCCGWVDRCDVQHVRRESSCGIHHVAVVGAACLKSGLHAAVQPYQSACVEASRPKTVDGDDVRFTTSADVLQNERERWTRAECGLQQA